MRARFSHFTPWVIIGLSVLILAGLLPLATWAEEPPPSSEATPLVEEVAPFSATTPTAAGLTPSGGQLSLQGVVSLSLNVPDFIHAGDDIQYTYVYTNTGDVAVNDVEIEVTWVNFALANSDNEAVLQYCAEDCGVLEGSVRGPDVSVVKQVDSGGKGRYRIGTLENGESGQFSVLLRSTNHAFPRTNEPVIRPSGSGRLFINRSNQPTSEDTNNVMVVGPILSIAKQTETSGSIYPLEQAQYTLQVGNATGDGDIVDGHIRADARDATGIVVEDTFPAGSTFASASGDYTVDTANRKVRWAIDETLAPGESTDLTVTYQKLDEDTDCSRMQNTTYSVTSDEMPWKDEEDSVRYTIAGKQNASIDVITPVRIGSAAANPSNVPAGNTTTINIVVENVYDQAVNGATLEYALPSDMYFVSASPSPSTSPDSSTTGGTAIWSLNLGAGSVDSPSSVTVAVTLQAGQTDANSSGSLSVQVPSSVPSACIQDKNGPNIKVSARLRLTKAVEQPAGLIEPGTELLYTVELQNLSDVAISGISLVDPLPGQAEACFTYVSDSARLDGTAREPVAGEGETCGTLVWDGVSVAANQTASLTYRLSANGLWYTDYCNTVVAQVDGEEIKQTGKAVCIQMEPEIEIRKSVDVAEVTAGESVRFTLTMINQNPDRSFEFGLYDDPGVFVFERQESGYAEPTYVGENLVWPTTTLEPGEQETVVFWASTPSECLPKKSYLNEGAYWFSMFGENYVIVPVPPVSAGVTVNPVAGCIPPTLTPTPTPTLDPNVPTPTPAPKIIRYSLDTDRTDVSLRDRLVYTMMVENTNQTTAASDVVVEALLPPGFIYKGLDPEFDMTGMPYPVVEKTETNETRVAWSFRTLEAGFKAEIPFIVTTSEVVGQYRSSLNIYAPDEWQVSATGSTSFDTMVKPLITIAPTLIEAPSGCKDAGTDLKYQVAVLNTNVHEYLDTTVVVTLPIGLQYVAPITPTNPPEVRTDEKGHVMLVWEGLLIPEKPANQAFSQVLLDVQLRVGQAWNKLTTSVEATNPDGLIPQKEGVADVQVAVCPPTSAMFGKTSDVARVWVDNDHVVYQLSFFNPSDAPLSNVSAEDVLPAGTQFVKMVQGPEPLVEPFSNTSRLVWSGLTVPARNSETDGLLALQYLVQIVELDINRTYQNTASVVQPVGVFTNSPAASSLLAEPPQINANEKIFLPVIRR